MDKSNIQCYLENYNFEALCTVEKSDFHCHASNGGDITYLNQFFGKNVQLSRRRFNDMLSFELWIRNNIIREFPGKIGYIKRLEATFLRLKMENIRVACISFLLEEILQWKSVENFIRILKKLQRKIAPETIVLPEISLKWNYNICEDCMLFLKQLINSKYFYYIDICGEEKADSVEKFIDIFRIAKHNGLILRAHVGEFGTYKEVLKVTNALQLDEIVHGISICENRDAMRICKEKKIIFNVCPYSNIMMGRVDSYQNHPIKRMVEEGLNVTICTDDCLIFGKNVTQQYMDLYITRTLTSNEIESIHEFGLARAQKLIRNLNATVEPSDITL